MFFSFWIRRAPCSYQVFFLLKIKQRDIWWPSSVFISHRWQWWHLVATKFFFFSLIGLKRQLVAIKCCVLLVINDKCTQRPLGVVFCSSFTRITHGGHQVHFFLFYGILKQLVAVRSFLSSCWLKGHFITNFLRQNFNMIIMNHYIYVIC